MDAIEALGDPIRRAILHHLRAGESRAGDIAHHFDLSRPAISRHLRVLRECGLVDAKPVGRERLYALNPCPLRAAREWIDGLLGTAPLDASHLDALATEVARARRDSRGAAAVKDPHDTKESA